VDLNTLRRFSKEGFKALPPEDFSEAADFCRDYGVNFSDMTFVVLERCFRLSERFWSPGEDGLAIQSQAETLENLWRERLPAILTPGEREDATRQARRLEQQIRLLPCSPP
jgi:hypothetical protein